MRVTMVAVLAAPVMLAACGGNADEERAAADAAAVNFTPPSVMSRLDYGSAITRRFRDLDRNADETLSRDELPSRNTRLLRLDRSADGNITAIEFSEGMLAWFDGMDLNHDGTVTSEERQASRR